MKTITRLLASAVLAVVATPATAATITYSDASAVPYLQKFDPLLGTLTSVTFTNRYVSNLYFNYSGDPSISTGPMIRVTGTIGDARFGLVRVDEMFQSAKQDPRTIGVQVSRTVSTTFFDGLPFYTGSGIMSVAAYANLTSPGLSPAIVSFPSPWSYVSVTYNYIASVGGVPEPGTWVMMLVGFGMVAGAARYRRRLTMIKFA